MTKAPSAHTGEEANKRVSVAQQETAAEVAEAAEPAEEEAAAAAATQVR